jgi:hypothetical protein
MGLTSTPTNDFGSTWTPVSTSPTETHLPYSVTVPSAWRSLTHMLKPGAGVDHNAVGDCSLAGGRLDAGFDVSGIAHKAEVESSCPADVSGGTVPKLRPTPIRGSPTGRDSMALVG